MTSRRTNNESYMHFAAKQILRNWLKNDYLKIKEEEKFCLSGKICFIPDLTCYDENGIKDLYEIVFKHDVDVFKQWEMYKYFEIHNWNVDAFTISAEWILKQIRKPNSINMLKIL